MAEWIPVEKRLPTQEEYRRSHGYVIAAFEGGQQMKQIVSKDRRVLCTTSVPYPAAVIKDMKKAGYKVTTKEEGK